MKSKVLNRSMLVAGLALLATPAFAGSNIPDSVVKPAATALTDLVVTGVQTIAPTNECSSVSVTITGKIQGTVDDGGGMDNVTFDLWDDGILKDSQTLQVGVGVKKDISVTLSFIGLYLTGAPGVGVLAPELGLYNDPFYPVDTTGNCPIKCWVTPATAKVGDTVTIQAEIPPPAQPSLVKAYNGDIPIATMTDPDGDGVYSGSWKVPVAMTNYGWKSNFSVMAKEGTEVSWCPGVKVTAK